MSPEGRILAMLAALLLLASACGGGEDGPSLDGRFLVVRLDGIYELSLATGNETPFLADPLDSYVSDPAVSPDGSQVAYVRIFPDVDAGDTGFSSDLYLARRDGGGPTEVYRHEHSGEQVRWPSWFPSGDAVLISAERFDGDQYVTEIRRVDIESGASETLANGATQPDVSSDGSMIAYVGIDPGGAYSLWVAGVDGSEPRSLLIAPPNAGSFQSPRFSPDGTQIAVAISNTFSAGARLPDGVSYVSRVANASQSDARASYNGFPMNVWVVDVASGEARALADVELDQPNLRWKPDGSTLFAHADAGLFTIDVLTGEASRVATGYLHGTFDWAGAE